jgi:hypothetical protein
LLRHWSHTWKKKNTKKNQNFDTLNHQPIQSFSMPRYTEKTGGLLHHQMPAPNLLQKHLADQKVSIKCHAVFPQPPQDKPAYPPVQTDPLPCKKRKNNQIINKELKRNTQQRGLGCCKCTRKGGGARN